MKFPFKPAKIHPISVLTNYFYLLFVNSLNMSTPAIGTSYALAAAQMSQASSPLSPTKRDMPSKLITSKQTSSNSPVSSPVATDAPKAIANDGSPCQSPTSSPAKHVWANSRLHKKSTGNNIPTLYYSRTTMN